MTYIAGNIDADMKKDQNLSGLTNYETARANLGLALSTIKDARIKEIGSATLVLGTVTITSANGTATAKIFATPRAGGTNTGILSVSTAGGSTNVTISSTNVLDNRVVDYIIIEP